MSNIEVGLSVQRQGSVDSINGKSRPDRRETLKEETVEALLEKLQKRGKNVKIIAESEELALAEQATKQSEEMKQLQELMSNMEA